MTTISSFNVSGATLAFVNQGNGSAFITSVLPPEDQSSKKEIVVIIDNKRAREGLFRRSLNKSGEVLERFSQWGANPEDVTMLSNFLNNKLTIKEISEKETSVKGNISQNGFGGEYTKKEKRNPI